MINNWTGVGRITKNPELKFTSGQNVPVVSFDLAVERNYKNPQGEYDTDFIQIVAWRKLAEVVASYTLKGSLIGVTGAIQTRNYQGNDGKTVYVTEIVADDVQLLEPKSVTDQRRQNNMGQNNYNQGQNNYNQGQQNYGAGQNAYGGSQNNYQNQNNQGQQNNQNFNKNNNPFENTTNTDNEWPFD